MIKIGSGQVAGLAGIGSVQPGTQGDSLELLLMMAQLQRAELIEGQLRGQAEDVQARNAALQLCTTLKSDLGVQRTHFSGDQSGGQLIDQAYYKDKWTPSQAGQFDAAYAKDPAGALAEAQKGTYGEGFKELSGVALAARSAGLDDATVGKLASGKITAAELDATVGQVTAKIDNYASDQELAQVQLQSMLEKRDEAFAIVTNASKKMSDNRASVVSNMR